MDDIIMEIVQEKFDERLKEAVDKEVKKLYRLRTFPFKSFSTIKSGFS